MGEDECWRFVHFVEVGGEVVERKVFHSLIVLVDCQYPSASSIPRKRRGDPPRSVVSFNPVSVVKLTVA